MLRIPSSCDIVIYGSNWIFDLIELNYSWSWLYTVVVFNCIMLRFCRADPLAPFYWLPVKWPEFDIFIQISLQNIIFK